jgi:hypothetical protein
MAIAVHSLLLSIIAIAILVLLAQKRLGLALATVGAFLTASCLGVGQSVQVQLDTGDQRLCFCGIPVLTHRPMHATVRKELMSLNDGRVPFGWTWCATQIGTHNADAMVYGFYCKAAAWVDVDPEIAKLALCDIAKYVQLTHARGGLPQCACLLWIVDQEDGRYKVPESWQDDAEIRQYLVSQGYVYRQ